MVTGFHEEFFDQLRTAERNRLEFEIVRKPITNDQIVSVTKSVLDGPSIC
jgi:hypothetical protein